MNFTVYLMNGDKQRFEKASFYVERSGALRVETGDYGPILLVVAHGQWTHVKPEPAVVPA